VAPDSRFVVQFSKDMDENTFNGHVLLALHGAGAARGSQLRRPQAHLRPRAARPHRRSGGRAAPAAQIELILLPGISDIDGMTLIPRGTSQKADVVDVLRYRVGS
jgi:hypothetical protein